MARYLAPILVLSLLVLGCGQHSTVTLAEQDTVVIWVEKSGNSSKTTPKKALLVDETQKVEWYSCDGELKIEFDAANPNRPPNPGCVTSGNKRCEMNAPAPGRKGSYKYTVTLVIGGVAQQPEDPVIIVDY